ncbi:MAG: alkaline phosphatase family protein [Candidatus Alkanophagales archaeon]
MRVFVLGLDGLEYELATKFDALRQNDFGKVRNDATDTWTPLCWGCVVTGLPPQRLRPLLEKKDRYWLLKPEVRTIFDDVPRHVKLFVPCMNPHPVYWSREFTTLIVPALRGDETARLKYELGSIRLLEEQYREVLKRIDDDWDLFFVHFNNPDMFSHVFFCNRRKMLAFYERLDTLASRLWERLGDDVARLVLSDHGFVCVGGRRPEHSQHAFYSCNVVLSLRNPHLSDFFNVVKSLLSV